MVSETAYYFTNILSAVSFISNIDAQALSMDEMEFERNMESAHAVLSGLTSDFENSTNAESVSTPKPLKYSQLTSPPNVKDPTGQSHKSSHSSATRSTSQDDISSKDHSSVTKNMSISDLEEKGASTILKENDINNVFVEFPYAFASVGDLTLRDVEDLLTNYKKLVFKYACLARGLGVTPALPIPSIHQQSAHNLVKKEERPETSRESDNLNRSSQSGLEIAESRPLLQDTVLALQSQERVEVSAVINSEHVVSEERPDASSNSQLIDKAMAPSTEEQNHDIQ